LIGYKSETQKPLYLSETDLPLTGSLCSLDDRSYVPGTDFFLKRKFMNTSNGKNFLAGSLVEQSDYFDELSEKVNFPEMFPCGLLSCALLERAMGEQHDFSANPMVFTSHKISVDRGLMPKLKSNAMLHMLVRKAESISSVGDGLDAAQTYECYGILGETEVLYRAEITLAPLDMVLKCRKLTKS